MRRPGRGQDCPALELVRGPRARQARVELPADDELGGGAERGRDPRVDGDGAALHVEVEPHAAVAEQEQVAQEIGFEDRDREVLEVLDDVGACVVGLRDPRVGAGVGHVFGAPAGVSGEAFVGPGCCFLVEGLRAELVPDGLGDGGGGGDVGDVPREQSVAQIDDVRGSP